MQWALRADQSFLIEEDKAQAFHPMVLPIPSATKFSTPGMA